MGTTSLTNQRLLPRAERELFLYEIVRFHVEDLNALAERRLGRVERRSFTDDERARMAAIVQAARWDRAAFLKATRRFIAEGRAEGLDAFGPALLMTALEGQGDSFLRDVPRRILDLVASAGAPATRARPAPRSRPPAGRRP